MLDLSILCLIRGGVVGIIRYNGGIAYLLQTISKRLVSQKHAELGIAFLTGIVNLCTANNTIAILVTGPVARENAADNKVAPARVARGMDAITCLLQRRLP